MAVGFTFFDSSFFSISLFSIRVNNCETKIFNVYKIQIYLKSNIYTKYIADQRGKRHSNGSPNCNSHNRFYNIRATGFCRSCPQSDKKNNCLFEFKFNKLAN